MYRYVKKLLPAFAAFAFALPAHALDLSTVGVVGKDSTGASVASRFSSPSASSSAAGADSSSPFSPSASVLSAAGASTSAQLPGDLGNLNPALAADPGIQRLIRDEMQRRQALKGGGAPLAKQEEPPAVRQGADQAEQKQQAQPAAASAEVSDLEKFFSGEDKTLSDRKAQPFRADGLTQFGYSFFDGGKDSFSPLTDIPVGPDYVVGPGDTIVLTLSGSIEGVYPLDVNRSGEVTLPKVGAVKVWGAPFGKLAEVVRAALSRSLRNFQVSVTMGKLRTVKVYVVGEVENPGDYSLNSLSTVINALAAAGGPTKNGSLRKVGVRRGGEMVETVDLYQFFLNGDKARDVRLQNGDVVFVPVIGPTAAVAGNVRRSAIYELKGGETLKDLVDLAGGVVSTGFLQRVQLTRVEPHNRRIVTDFRLDAAAPAKAMAAIPLADMDFARILNIDDTLRSYVKLDGYAQYPGVYGFTPGMRFSDVVKRDQLLPEYCETVAEITRYSPPDHHPESLIVNPGKALAGDAAADVALQEYDVIKLFSRWDMEEMPKVFLGGEVQRPGEFRLQEKMTVRDLVVKGGNLKQTAYRKSAEITRLRRQGDIVTSYPITVDLEEALRGNPKANLALEPFDHLMIRKIPEWAEETDRYVTLKGEVMFPGTYPMYKGERLSSVLRRAGGFTPKAYLKGAKFTRLAVAQQQQQRMDEILARTERDIAEKQQELSAVAASKEELDSTKAALDGLLKNVEKMKAVKAEGRVSMELAPPDELAKTEYDLELQGGDVLEVPQSPGAVTVVGEVYSPTTFVHRPGEGIGFYLEKAGGPTSSAEESEMYVIRPDGSVQSREQTKSFLFFSGFDSLQAYPGDTVVVPRKLEKIAWMREIKDIATILGQVALMAGVMVAAGL